MPAAVACWMCAGTYTASAPIGRFQMLSRVKGQVSGSRGGSPFGAGELEREVIEPVERSPCGATTVEPEKRTARDPATSTATKTSTKRSGRFRSSFGLVDFRRMLGTLLVATRATSDAVIRRDRRFTTISFV